MLELKILVVCWTFYLGLMHGGFFNVWLWRYGLDLSMFARSRCPRCASFIKTRCLIPLFGWILLGGKCRVCREKISVAYPLVETACSALFGIVAIICVSFAKDVESLNRALGIASWLGFVGLTIWSSTLFRLRKIESSNVFRAVVLLSLATFFLPASQLYLPFLSTNGAFLSKNGFLFVNYVVLSSLYSSVAIVGLSLARDWTRPSSCAPTKEAAENTLESIEKATENN